MIDRFKILFMFLGVILVLCFFCILVRTYFGFYTDEYGNLSNISNLEELWNMSIYQDIIIKSKKNTIKIPKSFDTKKEIIKKWKIDNRYKYLENYLAAQNIYYEKILMETKKW